MAKALSSQLQQQALNDLTMRAKSGIYIYVAIWLVVVIAFDFWTLAPELVLTNSVLILFAMLARVLHIKRVMRHHQQSVARLYQVLIIIVLLTALHWGVLTAWIVALELSLGATQLMLIVLPAFAMGGASTLSISNSLRLYYPFALYAPVLAVFFYQNNPLSLVYAVSVVISYVYIITASKYARENYWSAITNQTLAEQREAELERLSTTDQLTQLKNRMFFDKAYDSEWRRCFRSQAPISVIMIDFDHFKQLNDSYGHLFGDEVLRRSASLISRAFKRPSDCVARYGGEEFVVILAHTDKDAAKSAAERIRTSIENMEIEHQGERIAITCSIGGASVIPKDNVAKTELIKQADRALYQAKELGRNVCVVCEPESQL